MPNLEDYVPLDALQEVLGDLEDARDPETDESGRVYVAGYITLDNLNKVLDALKMPLMESGTV